MAILGKCDTTEHTRNTSPHLARLAIWYMYHIIIYEERTNVIIIIIFIIIYYYYYYYSSIITTKPNGKDVKNTKKHINTIL